MDGEIWWKLCVWTGGGGRGGVGCRGEVEVLCLGGFGSVGWFGGAGVGAKWKFYLGFGRSWVGLVRIALCVFSLGLVRGWVDGEP